MNQISRCSVCGHEPLNYQPVLWQELINEWELQPHEVDYVNRQQGLHCQACGNNLRSLALANAIMERYDYAGDFKEFVESPQFANLKLLEFNEAGGLTPLLNRLDGYKFAKFPEVDMQDMIFADESFDLIVHSDTLEHVPDPLQALSECYRTLKIGGSCIFTVPMVVERMTRFRKGMPDSFHGSPGERKQDYIVHSEFGADVWAFVLKAGFETCTIHASEYPAGIAIIANKVKK